MYFFGIKMIALIDDLDELLASNKNSLVGKWIEDAKLMTNNPSEKAYYEKDARKVITVWGEKGRDLNDYANRSLAGLVKDYYGGRWKIFIDETIKATENKQEVNQKEIIEKVNQFSWDWSEAQNPYSSQNKGNTKQISQKLYKKYINQIQEN